jgi:hypothetical protein
MRVYQSDRLMDLFAAMAAQAVRDYHHPAWLRGPDRRSAVAFLEAAGLIVNGVPDERLSCPCAACRKKRACKGDHMPRREDLEATRRIETAKLRLFQEHQVRNDMLSQRIDAMVSMPLCQSCRRPLEPGSQYCDGCGKPVAYTGQTTRLDGKP